ncbi:ROK family protein [Brevibacillus choshinensis]|uniref:ROK family protein n=1 Tax=Brevibacillus choshinensis TaxID=54911 RepID=A0ABX7FVE6_BRECH|nr:ROK family protein [Brevibacillus choshinensis]QRG70172.1 ROK family protein [Brevibacillus choshinensis]
MKKAIGIDVGGTKIRGSLIREDGILVTVREIPTEANRGGKAVMERIALLIRELSSEEIIGVGIGATGQVGLHGEILSATETFPVWAGIHLERELQERIGLPVRVVNDVQAMALGERAYGEGKNTRDFLCLALGTGVGGAIISQGELVRGSSGAAGEVGHMLLHPNGRRCPCGNSGCMEAYVSGRALEERYREEHGAVRTGIQIIREARAGDVAAYSVWEAYLNDLAMGIASLVTVLNPSKVILGGGVAQSLGLDLPALENRVMGRLSHAAARNFGLVLSGLGDAAMLLGACSLLFDSQMGK